MQSTDSVGEILVKNHQINPIAHQMSTPRHLPSITPEISSLKSPPPPSALLMENFVILYGLRIWLLQITPTFQQVSDLLMENLRHFLSSIKNSPIRGWGGLSKMSKKMSIIELSQIGQDLFDFSDLTWGHPLTHSSTHRYLQTKSNYINKFKLYYISHLTWPHPLIHTPIHMCGCLNKS